MNQNQVCYRAYVKGFLIAQSPFLTCGIEHLWDSETDLVFLRDNEGNPFLPGSSLAGVLRSLFKGVNGEEELFGTDHKKMSEKNEVNSTSQQNDSHQSCFITYDCFLTTDSEPSFATRDGIRLEYDNKVTVPTAKYDYEIVESGAKFDLKLELVTRKVLYEDPKRRTALFTLFNSLIKEMSKGIYLGSKKNRGLGLFILENPRIYEIYDEDAYDKYVNFDWDNSDFSAYYNSRTAKEGALIEGKRYEEWNIEVSFPASILIRSYYGKDVKMLTSNGQPVIPGTSWGGLFRHEARRILIELGYADIADKKIEDMFGTSADEVTGKQTKHKDKKASKVAFSDTVIKNSKGFKQTNVKIDRFTQGSADSALFDQQVVALGKTELTIRYREEWMKDLLSLVLEDLSDGLIAIGGQTSIGRGLCKLEKFKPSDHKALFRELIDEKVIQNKGGAL